MSYTILDLVHTDDGRAVADIVTDHGRRLTLHLPAGVAHGTTAAEDIRAAVELALQLRVTPP